jgi:hypothetical protein
MKSIAKSLIIFLSLLLTAAQCNHPEGWYLSGPMQPYLNGKWKLEQVITPTDTLTGSQIGYKEVLSYTHKYEMGYDSIFRNDKLFAVHIRRKKMDPVLNNDDMNVLIYYEGGLQRFNKIILTDYVTTLETSDYLKEVGSEADSVKYIYGRF